MKSAGCPLCVGTLLKIRMRSLPPSATNRRWSPSESTKRGKLNVASQENGYVGFPAASVPFEFWHNTGVCLVVESAAAAATPLNALLAIALVRFGCPSATSAGAPLAVGMPFQISTRL